MNAPNGDGMFPPAIQAAIDAARPDGDFVPAVVAD
jgi:hypothetical protein